MKPIENALNGAILRYGESTTSPRAAVVAELASLMCTTHHWRDHRHVKRPFGQAELQAHLAGEAKFGLCPIVPGSSKTRVALIDFDSHKGETPWDVMLEKARDVAFVLEQDGYQPVLWKSSGGQGIHLYLIFDEPQEARDVRHVLIGALAACGLRNGTGGVAAGQAEVFPKNESVPEDGYGSMWVLVGAGKSELIT